MTPLEDKKLNGPVMGVSGSLDHAMEICATNYTTCAGVSQVYGFTHEFYEAIRAPASIVNMPGVTSYRLGGENANHPECVYLSPAPPPPPHPPPIPPMAPPGCTTGKVWSPSSRYSQEATCEHPDPDFFLLPDGQTIGRCACPSGKVLTTTGECTDASTCKIKSPSPPPPSASPLPPPLPPLMPYLSPPTTLPKCTAAQEVQNERYCYNRMFTSSICQFDNGLHCPERCGLCKRNFNRGRLAVRIGLSLKIARTIYTFDRAQFRRRFADAIGISDAQLQVNIRAGSTIIEMEAVTVGGTMSEAATIVSDIESTFTDMETSSVILEETLLSPVTTSILNPPPTGPPSVPPSAPPPLPLPMLPPPVATPTPPSTSPPTPPSTSPPKSDDESTRVPVLAVVIASIAGAVILIIVMLVVCFWLPNSGKGSQLPYQAVSRQAGAVVVNVGMSGVNTRNV